MASDDFEVAEVDRLVEELKSRRLAAKPSAAPPASPTGVSDTAAATEHRELTPGRRWTTARLLMPRPATEHKKVFAFASAMHLPALPQLSLPAFTETQWRLLTARMFVGLGLVLSAAMLFWPYTNSCSWGLGLYLSAVLLVVISGAWGAKLTWDARLGAAHTLALCVVFWGLTLVTAAVLPRVGYAQIQEPWFCTW